MDYSDTKRKDKKRVERIMLSFHSCLWADNTQTHTHTHTHKHRPMYTQCVWLILSRKFSSSPAGRELRVWRQASGVFTEVNWLKLMYILHMIWYSPC